MVNYDAVIAQGEKELHALNVVEEEALRQLEAAQRAAAVAGPHDAEAGPNLSSAEEAYEDAIIDRECKFAAIGATILAKYDALREANR